MHGRKFRSVGLVLNFVNLFGVFVNEIARFEKSIFSFIFKSFVLESFVNPLNGKLC